MKVITGSENGLLKVISLEQNKVVQTWGVQEKGRGFDMMCWGPKYPAIDTEIVAAREDGTIQLWDVKRGLVRCSYAPIITNPKPKMLKGGITPPSEFRVKGLDVLRDREEPLIISCTENGKVYLRSILMSDIPDDGAPSLPSSSESSTATTNNSSSSSSSNSENKNSIVKQFTVSSPVGRMRVEPETQTTIAVGGKENDLSLWNLEKQECIWKAKNLRNDKLDLRQPVWITDLQYIPNAPHQIAVGTGYFQIRLYDTKIAQRRPIMQMQLGSYQISTITASHDGRTLLVGNAIGQLFDVDLRRAIKDEKPVSMKDTVKETNVMNKKQHGKAPPGVKVATQAAIRCAYRGIPAGIRAVSYHPSPEVSLFACTGLDRFLNVFSPKSLKPVKKIYLKQRVNTLLFSNELVSSTEIEEKGEKAEEEVEEVWEGLEKVYEEGEDEDEDESEGEDSEGENSDEDDEGDEGDEEAQGESDEEGADEDEEDGDEEDGDEGIDDSDDTDDENASAKRRKKQQTAMMARLSKKQKLDKDAKKQLLIEKRKRKKELREAKKEQGQTKNKRKQHGKNKKKRIS